MMKYKRFTERVGKGISVKETSTNDNRSIWNAIERLAELEDKIEQGMLIKRPPVKKGDSIWIVCRYRQGSSSFGSYYIRKVVRRCVDKIFLNNDNSFTISTLLIEKGVKHRSIVKSSTFMRTWFFTREEAEKRLKELQE